MMENHIMHCDDRRLKRLLAASDHDVESDPWLQHVDNCPNCQSRLRELAADDHDWQKTVAVLASSDDDTPSLGPNHAAQSGWNEAMVQHLLQPPSHPEMLGRLGRYEIERLIGSGGMGIVFKAFDTELNRPAAVKILAPYLANSRHARKRFAREARAAAGIVDDHVVPIFNVESEGEPPFLVMQYVAGGSLQERLDSGGPLEILEVLRIGLQTAKGLAAAHAQGLIHRDVKPSNILLDEGVERALLTDFGLARAEDEVSLTHTGFHPGTPDYMSPEQVRGETIDSRSDLFGLGCVLYALSTGRPPFHADTSYAVLRRITDQEPSPIQQINPKAPEWFEFIIKRLLAKSPADRFASAREVADLLERCLAHVHQPTDVPLPESLRRRSSPERTFSVRRSILGLLGVASLVAFGLFAAHNRGHEDSGSVANQSATNAPSDNRNFAAGVTDAGNERKGNDAARREFVRLAQQLESSFVVVPAGAAPQTAPGIQTANAPKAALNVPRIQVDSDDLAVHVEAMFLFEESQRGSHLGLMALRKLLLMMSNPNQEEGPTTRARAFERLVHYADRPILSEILFRAVNRSHHDRSTDRFLRAIINAPNVSKFVRPSAQLNLSKWMLNFEPFANNPEQIKRQIEDLAEKDDPASVFTLQMLERKLAAAPDAETFQKWKEEAIVTLGNLRDTARDIRPPGVKASGNRNILRISHALTKENPTLSELAAQALERHADARQRRVGTAVQEAKEAAARQEFIQLVEIFDRQFQMKFAGMPATLPDGDEQAMEDVLKNGFLSVELESLLQFEEQHRGNHIGLMALRKIITHSKRYGSPPNDVRAANRQAIQRLQHYGSVPMLADTLMRVSGNGRGISGFPDERTADALRTVVQSPTLSEPLRPMAELALCNWIMCLDGFVRNRERMTEQLRKLKSEEIPESQSEATMLAGLLDAMPSKETHAAWKQETLGLLEQLEKSATDSRLPAVKVDGHPDIFRLDRKAMMQRQTISEFAAALRKEQIKKDEW